MSVLGLLVAVVAVVFGSGWNEQVRFGLVLLGVTAPLRLFTDTHEMLIQSVKRFDIQSGTVIIKAFVMLTLQTLAVLAFGFYGMFLGVVLIESIGFLWWMKIGIVSRERPAFRLELDRARLRGLIAFGGPILVMAQVWLLYAAVDQLIVAGALSLKELGYYALATSVTTYILFLPKSIGSAVFPRMAEKFGKTGEISHIHHYATDVQRLLAYVLVPIATAGGFFAFPVLIRYALPEFQPAIDVVQVMVAASFFMALNNMPIKVLLTAGYRWSVTSIALGCTVVNGAINALFVIVLDKGLVGAATATAISYVITFLAITAFALSRAIPWRTVAVHLAEILAVFAYCYAAMRGLDAVVDSGGHGLVVDSLLAAGQLLAFVILLTPWLWLAEKRVGGMTMLRDLSGKMLARARKG
jgi:O-antigen/teichoic acid export membrane protein